LDLHLRRQQALAIGMRQQHDRLRDMADRSLGQTGLIVFNQCDDVPSWNVAVVDDREAVGVEIEADRGDLAGRDGRPHGARIQEIGEGDVVEVSRPAADLAGAFLAKDVAADGSGRAGHRKIIVR
jgi:hypothetical protein